jgi:hypothetical protein
LLNCSASTVGLYGAALRAVRGFTIDARSPVHIVHPASSCRAAQ